MTARSMGGAKRYPSIAVYDPDGFREGLNPSYGLYTNGVLMPVRLVEQTATDQDKQPQRSSYDAYLSAPHLAISQQIDVWHGANP